MALVAMLEGLGRCMDDLLFPARYHHEPEELEGVLIYGELMEDRAVYQPGQRICEACSSS